MLFCRVGRTARAGRHGLAISIFRFPRDLQFLEDIESVINTKLTEHQIDQRMVERIFMQVSVSKREQEMVLDNNDFDERASNYRRLKWLEEGLDPDEMENKFKDKQKEKQKQRKKIQKEFTRKKTEERATSSLENTFETNKNTNISVSQKKFIKNIDEKSKNIKKSSKK